MSFKKFPDYMFEIVNTGGTVSMGGLTSPSNSDISNIYIAMIFYDTSLFSTERIRLNVGRSTAADTISSSWVTPSSVITDFTTTDHWIGNVRFDFDRFNILTGESLAVELETDNYTYNVSGTQIGAIMNYINSSGQFEPTTATSAYMTLFSY